MKKQILTAIILVIGLTVGAQKTLFIPTEFSTDAVLKGQWSASKSYQSENFVVYWGNVVGADPSTYANADLRFNPKSVCDTLEKSYTKYIKELKFISDSPDKNLGKYKIIIMMNDTWGTGGPSGWAFGGNYDDVIGAMWVHPNATRDGGVICHEFAHSLQGMVAIQENPNCGYVNYEPAGFFWECHANFMRCQIYPRFAGDDLPRWMGTGMFHWSSTRHHYDSFKLLFHIQQTDSFGMITRLWKESVKNEHPLMTYKRLKGWSQSQLNDFIFDYAKREVICDYNINGFGAIMRKTRDQLKNNEPHYMWRWATMLKQIDTSGRYIVPEDIAPQDYGYNIIPLYPKTQDGCSKRIVHIKFKGHTEVNNRTGWRYGFVAVKPGPVARYSEFYSAGNGEATFEMNTDETELYLVVVGAPTIHSSYVWEPGWPKIYRFPYELKIENAVPEGFQSGYRHQYKTNGHNHSNGGGWVSNTSTVALSAYVGPNAIVLGSSNISGNAHIDGNAWVESATVSDNVIIDGNANVFFGTYSGNAKVTDFAISNYCTLSGNALLKGNAMEWGVTFGNSVVVGGDAEIGNCSNGVYLQCPHDNNGRTDCDGKGANDKSNTDINAKYTQFADSLMAYTYTAGCSTTYFPPKAGRAYKIVANHSNKSLTVQDGLKTTGTKLVQFTFKDSLYQKFLISANGNNVVFSPLSVQNKALDVDGNSTLDGANILQNTSDNTTSSQQWSIVDAGDGHFNIKSVSSGKCMEVNGASINDNAEIKQATCGNYDQQKFLFTEVAVVKIATGLIILPGQNNFLVYPNPAQTKFTVELNNLTANENTTMYIFDLQGREVYTDQLKSIRKKDFDTSILNLKNSLYFLRTVSAGKVFTQKLLVAN